MSTEWRRILIAQYVVIMVLMPSVAFLAVFCARLARDNAATHDALIETVYLTEKAKFLMDIKVAQNQPKNPASVRQLELAVDAWSHFIAKYPDAKAYNRRAK